MCLTVSQSGFAQKLNDETKKVDREEPAVTPVRRIIHVSRPLTNSAKAVASATTVPFWAATQGTYTYQMIGQNPMVAQTTQTTTIPTLIVPLTITIPNGSTNVAFDPTVSNACQTSSALSLLQASPIFNSTATFGGTQYHDYFQRSNFAKYTGSTGINPNFHILLSQTAHAKVAVTVPAADGQVVANSCGQRGEINLTWLDSYIQGTIFPALSAAGVTPATFVVFLMNNVVMYETTAANCCALGYHSAFSNPAFGSVTDTYAVGDFDTTGVFGTTADTSPLSHEIGEWMDDPMGNNPTPGWGNVSTVVGCQYNLEVGDPLAGTNMSVVSGGYTYHIQELAFVSWFYRASPSTGLNGWYSLNGTFKTPAGSCETSTTTLSITPASLSPGSTATISVVVAAGAGFSGTPIGTVTLVQSGTSTVLGTYTLASGAVKTTLSTLPAGSYSVTANYAGDANFEASTSAAVTLNLGAPNVTLTPVALTFASQTTAISSTAQVATLKNSGNAPLTGVAISLAGASPGDYSQTNTCGASVAVGASCSISVTFKPAAAGNRTASVSIADNASGSPQSLPLSGTASPPPAPAATLSFASLTFASTVVGSSSATQAVTLTNSGTASMTSIAISLAGSNAGDYSQTNTCSGTLAVAANCLIAVTFKPTASGARTASIGIADNATGSPQNVLLAGTGTASAVPAVSLSATTLAFASTKVATAAAVQKITVTNSGSATLSSLAITVTGTNTADFTQTNTCTTTLAAGANCAISVTFKPTATGARSASVNIVDTATGSPQKVTLTGTGA